MATAFIVSTPTRDKVEMVEKRTPQEPIKHVTLILTERETGYLMGLLTGRGSDMAHAIRSAIRLARYATVSRMPAPDAVHVPTHDDVYGKSDAATDPAAAVGGTLGANSMFGAVPPRKRGPVRSLDGRFFWGPIHGDSK